MPINNFNYPFHFLITAVTVLLIQRLAKIYPLAQALFLGMLFFLI